MVNDKSASYDASDVEGAIIQHYETALTIDQPYTEYHFRYHPSHHQHQHHQAPASHFPDEPPTARSSYLKISNKQSKTPVA
jgi:hypothetical protein